MGLKPVRTKQPEAPSEGAGLAQIVRSYTEAIDTTDVVKRLDALHAAIKEP